jgi:hypothetical protein
VEANADHAVEVRTQVNNTDDIDDMDDEDETDEVDNLKI